MNDLLAGYDGRFRPRKPRPDSRVKAFYEQRERHELYISTVNMAEMRYGIQSEVSALKRNALETWLTGTIVPFFAGRTLEVTEDILLRWRILLAYGRRNNRTYPQPDLFLAATALDHNLTLVTRNTRDFAGLPGIQLLNPFEDREPDQRT